MSSQIREKDDKLESLNITALKKVADIIQSEAKTETQIRLIDEALKDLKYAVKDNNIPEYSMEWIEKNGKSFVIFKRSKIHEIDRRVEEFEKKQEK